MAKLVVYSLDPEITELRKKCRAVKDRISKIGHMLPSITIESIQKDEEDCNNDVVRQISEARNLQN